ncbi:hypothetical protein TK90_2639 (plasmid) [Thioalkalivibrio sp. K90mix]|uniref:hypothetical protein n=1 Tax=Thioalkalivibrio sp. (strain K90mix) TaxID=396595 RepID=UPI000195AB9B|nr:hypothetical protein [Thioalkalivibrio sp. K90mix]ADC73126.1 hypothetical protein TK90_2639 [Thioalkalivibrio sp. K90mix]
MSTDELDNNNINKMTAWEWVRLFAMAIGLIVAIIVIMTTVYPSEISDERYEKVTQMVEAHPELRGTVSRLMEEGCGVGRRHAPCLTVSNFRGIERRYEILTGQTPGDRLARDLDVVIE